MCCWSPSQSSSDSDVDAGALLARRETSAVAAPDRNPFLIYPCVGEGKAFRPQRSPPHLLIGNSYRLFKDSNEQRTGQLAGLRVLVGRVIRGQ